MCIEVIASNYHEYRRFRSLIFSYKNYMNTGRLYFLVHVYYIYIYSYYIFPYSSKVYLFAFDHSFTYSCVTDGKFL